MAASTAAAEVMTATVTAAEVVAAAATVAMEVAAAVMTVVTEAATAAKMAASGRRQLHYEWNERASERHGMLMAARQQ